ncbi:MSCRAMM family protein [Flavitalea flava]
MTDSNFYSSKSRPYRPFIAFWRIPACLLLFMVWFIPAKGFAGNDPDPDPVPAFDEILILLNVQGIGGVQIPAAIRNDIVYLSVTDIFDFLKIRNIPSARMDSISGFFINPQAPYLIDKKNNRILYQGKIVGLHTDDLILSNASLYMRSDYFGKVFGLECKFNFRSLSVILNTKIELPIIREMRQQLMRNNISRLRGEIKADTTIFRSYPGFRFGVADWSVVSTQDIHGQNDTRLNLGMGSVIAGGETNVLINYDNRYPFREREQLYQWHYVDNDRKELRQVLLGKYFPQSISSIYFPVVGMQFTNSPTTYRRSFGTYPLSGYTDPNWIVELYVNNELVNYIKADASGFYNVEVPLVYGNSAIKLRFYGPWGEERSSEQLVQIPFNFLPFHQLEYTAGGGIEEDSLHSRFSRANFNYGLSTHLTVGTGVEYLSSVTSGKLMPFVNASARVGSNLLLAGEYTYGVRGKFVANYHLPSDLQFEVNYTRYKRGQTAINNTFLEERKAILSYPFRTPKFSLFSRTTFYQIVLPSSKYTTLEQLFSGVLFGASTNFTTYALLVEPASPYVYSNLSMAFRVFNKLLFTPQIQYEYNDHNFMYARAEIGKYINYRGYVNVYVEKNYKTPYQAVGIGFRYDLTFARIGSTFIHSKQTNTMINSASGSLLYDNRINYLGYNNRSSVGRGGILIQGFLDLNGNGKWDRDEPKAGMIRAEINSGRITYNKADTSIRISDLEAYANYTVRLTPQFDHIAWEIRNQIISVAVDPNQFKLIAVPVTVMGEVSGSVYLSENGNEKPQGRVLVCFYQGDSVMVAKTITEADGSFDFTGLAAGTYTARINYIQLQKLDMISTPAAIPFTLVRSLEGGLVSGLRFVLQKTETLPPARDPLKNIFKNSP